MTYIISIVLGLTLGFILDKVYGLNNLKSLLGLDTKERYSKLTRREKDSLSILNSRRNDKSFKIGKEDDSE